jgi:GTPase
MDSLFDQLNNKFYPENHDGDTEYKWRLDTKNELGFKKLYSQMLWRMNEGFELSGIKKAKYLIGVYDNGNLGRLSVDELITSINILKNITAKNNLNIINEQIKNIDDSNIYYAEIIQKHDDIKYTEKYLIIIGEPQSGKTSLISQLCYNSTHKKYILKHDHEKQTGFTTDIKKEIIGIKNNNIINYCDYCSWDDIAKNSDIIINIYDIPVLNIKTIITYLLGIKPDFVIIISKSEIITYDIKFYIDFCVYYNIDFINKNINDVINYNQEYFNKLLLEISNLNNKQKNIINNNINIFTIIDYYDIPEKGLIVSGIMKNNSFKENNIVYLINNNEKYEIKLNSIYKKTIKTNEIYENESGSINISFIDKNIDKNIDKKVKISKHSFIINFNNLNFIRRIKLENFSFNNIGNGFNNIILFNGNYNINIDCNIIGNEIIFDKDIFLQDTHFIILIINKKIINYNFNDLILCKIIN